MMRERGKGVGTRDFEALKQKLLTDDWGMEEEDDEEEDQSSMANCSSLYWLHISVVTWFTS
jgi:hypothetical protein